MMRRPRGEFSITYMSGALDGKTLSFEQPPPSGTAIVTMGRREGCDIQLQHDNQVSRLHSRLICSAFSSEDSGSTPLLTFWLEDSGSRNGTFLDKDPTPIVKRVSLRPGTLFRVGRTWLRLDVPLSFGD